MKNILTIITVLFVMTGCVSNIGIVGMASTQTELAPNAKYKKLGTCKATDEVLIFLWPWGESRIETALKSCMEKYPTAAYVSNARIGVYQNNWGIIAWVGYQVEGTVYGRVDSTEGKAAPVQKQDQSYLLRQTETGLALSSATELIPVQALVR